MSSTLDPQAFAREIDAINYTGFSVRPEYIDDNGHLNVGYYTILFDRSLGLPWERLGISSAQIRETGRSSFTLESHLTYLRELRLGDPVTFSILVLDYDAKRIHYFLRMHHAREKWLAATCEQLSTCVDLATRRTARWPEPAMDRIAKLAQAHAQRPRPEGLGRPIGIRRKAD
jgi:acyl-CoA thioester hydrolase